MGRKDSARGPFAERCFLVGPFRSAASADAPLCREAFSSSLVQLDVGLSALQLRFLVTSCLAGACVTDLAAGWRVFARPSNILTRAEGHKQVPLCSSARLQLPGAARGKERLRPLPLAQSLRALELGWERAKA